MGRYTTPEDVQSQLGRTLTDNQIAYLEARIIPAAEEWVDVTGGRVYGSGVVTAEPLLMSSPYTWLTTTPVESIQAIRGYLWGQTEADAVVLPTTDWAMVDGRNGQLYLPSWRGYAHLEIDYTPNSDIPDRIKLATAIVCGVYMRTVLHPESEWLSDYASGVDLRVKFRSMEMPATVYELIGTGSGNFVVA